MGRVSRALITHGAATRRRFQFLTAQLQNIPVRLTVLFISCPVVMIGGEENKKMVLNAKEIQEFEHIYAEADAAGKAAVEKLNVVPMVVQQHANQLDDNSPVVQQWFVADGVCGFAWVNIGPANKKFAKFLVAKGLARKDSYNGGISMHIWDYNQSMQKKEAYARGFVEVLGAYKEKLGLKRVWVESRID